MDDYSDLIIVNYAGGYGGDFFCSLLYKNFDTDYSLMYRKQPSNHVYFAQPLESFKDIRTILLCISAMWQNTFEKRKLSSRFPFIQNKVKLLYDDDYDEVVQNLTDACRHLYDEARPKIWPVHYDNNPKGFEKFKLDTVFPNSKKLRLVCSDVKYHVLFIMLATYKSSSIIMDYNNINEHICASKSVEGITAATIFNKEFDRYEPFQDFFDVDVGKLYFENDDCTSEIEQQLTMFLGAPIKLDRGWLKSYRQKNKEILEHMLGHTLKIDDVDNNLLDFKNYFIRNNMYYVE